MGKDSRLAIWRQRFSQWGGPLVMILFVAALLWLVPLQGVAATLQAVAPETLLLALLFWALQQYLTALRLRLLATRQQILLTTPQVLTINLTVSFYQLFVPGAVVGAGLRWYQMTQAGGEKAAALTAVTLNRLLDAFFGATLGLAFLLLARQGTTTASGVVLLGMVGLTAVCWLLFARFTPRLLGWLQSQIHRWHHRWAVWLLEWAARLLVCAVVFAETAVLDLLLLGLVGAAQFLATVLHFVFLAWAVGIDLPLLLLGAVRSALQITGLIPFAFVGVREAGLLALLASLGVTAEKAVALSLLISALSMLTALLGGVIELVRKNFRRTIISGRGRTGTNADFL